MVKCSPGPYLNQMSSVAFLGSFFSIKMVTPLSAGPLSLSLPTFRCPACLQPYTSSALSAGEEPVPHPSCKRALWGKFSTVLSDRRCMPAGAL